MVDYTYQEWLAEVKKRFGDDPNNWAFACPACGKVSTIKEFKNAGADPNDAYQACIGRYTGKGAPVKDSKEGCNWVAFGVLGTLDGGDMVTTSDGKRVRVFSMAGN